MLICDNCGKTYEAGRFCVDCGTDLRPFLTAESLTTGEKTVQCPDCKTVFDRGSFCLFCGTALAPLVQLAEDLEPLKETVPPEPEVEPEPVPEPEPVKEPEPVPEPAPEPAPAPEVGIKQDSAGFECVICGARFPGSSKTTFCTECGGDIRPIIVSETVNQAPPAPEPTMTSFTGMAGMGAPSAPPPVPPVPPTPPTPAPAPAPAVTELRCPQCGKTFQKGKFCTSCGVKLEAPAKKLCCTQCGKEFDSGKFCTVCGGRLE